jgi:hypothetical protein
MSEPTTEEEPCDVHGWRDCKRCRNRSPAYDLDSAHREIARLNAELKDLRTRVTELEARTVQHW